MLMTDDDVSIRSISLNVSLDFRGTLLKFTFLLSEVVSCRSDVDCHKKPASFCVFVYLCAFSVYFCFYVFVSFCDIVCFLCLSQILCIFGCVSCVFL